MATNGSKLARFARWLRLIIVTVMIVVATLAIYTNVSTEPTEDDIKVFELQLGIHKPTTSLNYNQQLTLIRSVQYAVWARSPFGKGIAPYENREPAALLRAGQGSCFDISRTYDKAFNYLGLKTRHVYLLFKEERSFPDALLRYQQSSHAVTEVKTSKGWLFVDSNSPWIAVTTAGEPINADTVWKRIDEFDAPPPYLNEPWWAIRGMYSRKGHLYTSWAVPFPELNWSDFVDWLING